MSQYRPCCVIDRDGATGFLALQWGNKVLHRKVLLVDTIVPRGELQKGFPAIVWRRGGVSDRSARRDEERCLPQCTGKMECIHQPRFVTSGV